MKLPSKIKVGGRSIEVRMVEKGSIDSYYGQYCDTESYIDMVKGLAKDVEAASALHEVLHALFSDAGLNTKFSKDDEEIIIRVLEPRLMALIKDNPKFVSYLQRSVG